MIKVEIIGFIDWNSNIGLTPFSINFRTNSLNNSTDFSTENQFLY